MGIAEPGEGEISLEVQRPGGIQRMLPDPEDPSRIIVVMLGTPRIHQPAHTENGQQREAMTIKANRIVLWVKRHGFDELDSFAGLSGEKEDTQNAGQGLGTSGSVIPEAMQGIYAEGAVELTFGDYSFRSPTLYLEPHTHKALLIEPRVDAKRVGVGSIEEPLPLHIRAVRARLVERGLMVFDDAEVSSSRAEDRVSMGLQVLSAQRYSDDDAAEGGPEGPEGPEEPEILGFQANSSLWFSGRRMTVHGERLPLMWLPRTEFVYSPTTQALSQPFQSIDSGRNSRKDLGYFLFVRVGGSVGSSPGSAKDPLFDWSVAGGGYEKRGWGGGAELKWDHTRPTDRIQSRGYLDGWAVWDNRSFDSSGFVSEARPRGRIVSESSTWLQDDLRLDLSYAHFSDRGFNNEFLERDDLHHKDRESYAHLRWAPRRPGNLIATLDGKWHERPFVTETADLPTVGLWALPVPLLKPGRRGGLAIDLTTRSEAGYLGRRFDEALPDADYEAWRFSSLTTMNFGVDAGDVRLSGFVGGSGAMYEGRTDGGRDLTRSALVAGVRANLQLNRVFPASGTWMQLNGLRHVVDIDVGAVGRFLDSAEPADVPFFDRLDSFRERTAGILLVRNRLQTRARPAAPASARPALQQAGTDGLGLRTVADLEVALRYWADDIGPYGRDSPGAADITFYGEPRPGFNLAGEAHFDFRSGLETGSLGSGIRCDLREKPFALFGGIRYARDQSLSLTADTSWRFSEKYAVRALVVHDFLEGENTTKILFRRYSPDHIIVFGFNLRNGEDLGLEFSLEPAIGGRSTEGPLSFKDEPNQNPWGAFR